MDETIHLDTNYLVKFSAGQHEEIGERVLGWMKDRRRLYASAMAWAEFQCGPLGLRDHEAAQDMLHGVLPITLEQANRAGWLFQMTGRRSRSLPDCVIAACAMDHGALLATDNTKDFKPFIEHGLQLT
ncbi:MAG: type II toxin-antitoxin system VapC family toxin [Roseimicrobium sp.]